MNIQHICFTPHGDERGQLIALEEGNEIPFSIKRIYYIYNTTEGVRRGFHAHKTLKQVLFCIGGSCKLHLDDGTEQMEIELSSPDNGILLEGIIWREMYDFSDGAILVVLASEIYNEDDYIRSYDDFRKYINKE